MKTSLENTLRFFGGTTLLGQQTAKEIFRNRFPLKLTIDQIYHIGILSLPIVLITAASTGMVMALQFGVGLEKFGGKMYVPKIVSLSIIREMGPVFTALMLAARVGAGIASELGSMTVTQQIDAMRALGTSPIQKVVVPRIVACMIAIPILVAVANMIGVLGGLIVGVNDLGLDPLFYMQKVFETITVADYYSGWGKAPFFAMIIALNACYYGLNVEEGTRGVGSATTKSVVTSCILIFIGDYFLTKAFWMIELWL